MSTAPRSVRSTLTSRDGVVEVVQADLDRVTLRLVAGSDGDFRAQSRLLCGAIAQQRRRHVGHVEMTLDGDARATSTYLDALRGRLGADVRSIAMRRAGSSVMVDLSLLPSPPARSAGITSTELHAAR